MEVQPTGKNLFEQMREIDPNRHAVFNAIDKLKTPEEMRQFLSDYAAQLKVEAEEDPKQIAGREIGYALGYISEDASKRWMEAVPEVSHPAFGKNIPWGEGNTVYVKGSLTAKANQSRN